MNTLINGLMALVLLAPLMRFGLHRLERGRRFSPVRIWIACGIVVSLCWGLFELYQTSLDEKPGLLIELAIFFLVGCACFGSILRDIEGAPLSSRGMIGLAAIPAVVTTALFSLVVVVHLLIFLWVFFAPSVFR